MSTQQDEEVH